MRWVGWFLARAVAVMDIHETFVPESHRGRDLGATLAHAAFTLAASRGLASPWDAAVTSVPPCATLYLPQSITGETYRAAHE